MTAATSSGKLEGGPSRLAIEQAIASLRSGDPVDAERTLRQHLAQQPADLEVMARLGDILADQGRLVEASLLYKRILSLAPKAHQVRIALAHLLNRQGQFKAALEEIEATDGPARATFAARTLEGDLLGKLGIHDRELLVYEALIADFPDNAMLWRCLGDTLKTVGRTDEAIAALRKAAKILPTYGVAYWTLANLKTFRFAPRDLADMRKALRGKLSPDDALHFHFSLGKALEDRGNAAESFRHYAAGNAIRAGQIGINSAVVTQRVNAAIAGFSREFLEARKDWGSKAPDPIFVVSLQRSGSTLIEQILASHPMIEGTAELMVLEQIWERLGAVEGRGRGSLAALYELDREQIEALGNEYLERTRAYRLTARPYFVDKLPANWMNVGLIRLILPNAKIIDARRHPMACGFSNFRQNYASGVTFSYSQETIGAFYRDYWRLMNHFDAVDPGGVHHVINERLIEDTEGEVRRILEYVGVPFDPACLDFHKTKRAVHSASSEQVRRPINRDGVDSWRPFEPWLGPMKQALGPALDDWDRVPI